MKALLFSLFALAVFVLGSCTNSCCANSSKTAAHPRAADPAFALSSPVGANEPPLIH